MRVLMHKSNVSLFIDLIALYMNPLVTFVIIYGLIFIGNRQVIGNFSHMAVGGGGGGGSLDAINVPF